MDLDERVAVPPNVRPIVLPPACDRPAVPRVKGALRSLAGLGCLALVALGIGIGAMASPRASAQTVVSASSIQVQSNDAAGRDLFLANCAACHGAQGAGTTVAATIVNAGPAMTDYVLRTGRMPLPDPNSPSVSRTPIFNSQQIAALVAYVSSLGSGPAIPQVAISGADVALGRDLFIANCAACHGAAGTGDAVGGGFVAPSLHEADPLTVGEAVTVGPGQMPVFHFKQPELNALAAYVQQLRSLPSPGGLPMAEIGPVPEGFVAGFVGLVALLGLVRWIGRRTQSPLPPIVDATPGDEVSTGGADGPA